MEKELFKGKVLRLTVEPKKVGGKTIKFEKVYLKGSVHVFVITPTRKIRLVREKRWEHSKVQDKVVSGIMEEKETPLQCAKRELKEEMGLTAKHWEKFMVAEQKGTINDVRYYFIARDIKRGSAHPEDGEEIVGYVDYSLKALFNKAVDGYFGSSPTVAAITKLYGLVKRKEVEL